MKKLIRKGKVKEVYDIGDEHLMFFFTDNISVFDKVIPTDVPRKGESLCKTSTYWFNRIEEDLRIKTHFIEMLDKQTMKVKKVDVIEDYDKIDHGTTNYLIPLEFICRYYVAGSLNDRIQRGEVDYKDYGFKEMPSYGDKLPKPHFEVTTKLEKFDRHITYEEALEISGLTDEEYLEIKDAVMKIDRLIEKTVEKNGLLHVDGKKEFAMDKNRDIMIIDSFGTADEDRFWELREYKKGNFVEKSKEFVRQYYRDIGYHKDLMEARRESKDEPMIPSMPEDVKNAASELYVDLMTRLTDGTYK